jgi:hypothetical protein
MTNEINLNNMGYKLQNLNPYIELGMWTLFKETTSDSQHYHSTVLRATTYHNTILTHIFSITHPDNYHKKVYEDEYINLAKGNMGVDPDMEPTTISGSYSIDGTMATWNQFIKSIIKTASTHNKSIEQCFEQPLLDNKQASECTKNRCYWFMNHGCTNNLFYCGYNADCAHSLCISYGLHYRSKSYYQPEDDLQVPQSPTVVPTPTQPTNNVIVITIDEDGNRQEQQTQFTVIDEYDDDMDPDEVIDQAEGGIIEEIIENNDDQIEVIDITMTAPPVTPDLHALRIRTTD